MQTLKQRAVVTGVYAGVLLTTGILVFLPVPLRERLIYALQVGAMQGWITYACLSAALRGGARRAGLLVVAGVPAISLVSVLFAVLV